MVADVCAAIHIQGTAAAWGACGRPAGLLWQRPCLELLGSWQCPCRRCCLAAAAPLARGSPAADGQAADRHTAGRLRRRAAAGVGRATAAGAHVCRRRRAPVALIQRAAGDQSHGQRPVAAAAWRARRAAPGRARSATAPAVLLPSPAAPRSLPGPLPATYRGPKGPIPLPPRWAGTHSGRSPSQRRCAACPCLRALGRPPAAPQCGCGSSPRTVGTRALRGHAGKRCQIITTCSGPPSRPKTLYMPDCSHPFHSC